VRWIAPVDGGSPVTAYQVEVLDSADRRVGALLPAAATATEVTVTGLTSQRYWLRVFAVNGVDVSEASGESSAVPGTRPGSARIGTAAPDDSAAVVHWLAPADDGGLAVTGYRVRAVDESGAPAGSLRSASAASTRLRVRGLTNGEAYRFQVAAVNEMGVGRFSRLSAPWSPVRLRPGRSSGDRIRALPVGG
jgi:predicted phage tail protein